MVSGNRRLVGVVAIESFLREELGLRLGFLVSPYSVSYSDDVNEVIAKIFLLRVRGFLL